VYSDQQGPGQLFSVGSKYYYVTIAQVGVAENTNLLTVYKSSDITTWTIAATLPPATPPASTAFNQDAPAILIGTTIYIVCAYSDGLGSTFLQIHIYDTATDSFSESSLGTSIGGAGQQLWSLSAQNDGSIIVSTTKIPGGVAFGYVVYTPGTDTWGSFTSIVANASQVLQQAHDPVTDNTYIFYVTPLNAVRCFSIEPSGPATDDALVYASLFPVGNVGTAIVSAATSEVVFVFRKFITGTSTLFAIRSSTAWPPVFSVDTVDDGSALPPGTQIQQYDQIASGGWFPVDIAGVLYAFYAVDNGELDSASSESYIYYRTSSGPGVWSAPTLAYTTPIPAELLTPYGVEAADGTVVLMLGLIDPTLWPNYSSLSNVVLYSSPTPAAPTVGYIAAQLLTVIVLPDPSKDPCI